jgi:hypothetical protein
MLAIPEFWWQIVVCCLLLQAAQSHRSALQIGLSVVNRVLAAQPREFVLDTTNSGGNFASSSQIRLLHGSLMHLSDVS